MLPYSATDTTGDKPALHALEADSGHFLPSRSFTNNVITIPKTTLCCLYGGISFLILSCIVLVASVATISGSTACSHAHGEPCDNIAVVKNPLGLKMSSVLDGELCTKAFRITYVDSQQKAVSPWHHIPLKTSVDDEFNMVVEIPKNTKRKWEISTKEENNPIVQDLDSKGELREYAGPFYWNYGALPRTFEAPGSETTGSQLELEDDDGRLFKGDGDPLDVVEIGDKTFKVGEIARVKVLGILAMIDSGEVDWKLIAISTGDSRAADLTLDNIDERMPGVVSGILEWVRWDKTPAGNKLTIFGRAGKPFDKDRALQVITETHEQWKKLVGVVKGELDYKSEAMWVPKDFDPAKADQEIGQAA